MNTKRMDGLDAAGVEARAKVAIVGLVEMHKQLLITLEAQGSPFLPDHNYEAWSNTVLDAMTVIGDLTQAALASPTPSVAALERLKYRIDARLNNVLCDMKPKHDDSIHGFNEAWRIVDEAFKEASHSPILPSRPEQSE